MSASQFVSGLGPSTISGALQWMPSGLSVRAMLAFGRQENHIRNRPDSFRTETSKQVPSDPPRTGLPAYLIQPAAVSPAVFADSMVGFPFAFDAGSRSDASIPSRSRQGRTKALRFGIPPGMVRE